MTAITAATGTALEPALDSVGRATAAWLLRYSSAETRRAYATSLRRFRAFLADHDGPSDPAEVTRGHVDAWKQSLIAAGVANSTVAARIGGISSWFQALAEEGITAGNPAGNVRRPHVNYREGSTQAADPADIATVTVWLRQIRGSWSLAVEIMARWGLRVDEVCGLRPSDTITDTGGSMVLVVHGKGGRPGLLRVPLGDPIIPRLEEAAERGEWRDRYVTGRDGGLVEPDDIRRVLRQASARCGIEPPIRPHQLRVFAITSALDAGHLINDVSAFARHATLATTQRYDRNPGRRVDAVAASVTATLDQAASSVQQCTQAPEGADTRETPQ